MENDKLKINDDTATELFNKLTNKEKNMLVATLNNTKFNYIKSGIPVDLPYFFWSVNRPLFVIATKEDVDEFLEIDDSRTFSIFTVYYISKFILDKRA